MTVSEEMTRHRIKMRDTPKERTKIRTVTRDILCGQSLQATMFISARDCIISTQGIRFTAGTSISNTAVGVYSGYNIFPNVPAWAPWKLNGD